MSKTLIFGATGHIGQAVARQLVAEGRSVHLVGRDAAALTELAAELQASHSLLELAEQNGLKPLAGCRVGVCHQCKCTKKSGVVLNTLTGQYSDTGREDIQLCVSVPVNDVVLDV